jgi:intein-encoded DNA endonuclease-like protein
MGAKRKNRHRTLEERLASFSHVRQLTSEGLPPSDVASAIGISLDDVRYWLRVKKPSRERYVPDLTPRPELSYLIGAYLGDGQTAGEEDKKVRFKVADLDFANILNETVSRVLGTRLRVIRIERGFHCVVYDSAVLYDFLQQPIEPLIPYAETSPESFLRGFFDAEGYVTPRLDYQSKRLLGLTIGVANSNPDYLGCVKRLLVDQGIQSSYRLTHKAGEPMTIRGRTFIRKHDVQHLILRGSGAPQVFETAVGFSISAKRDKLADLVWLSANLDSAEGYRWFVTHYEQRRRRWVKKDRVK